MKKSDKTLIVESVRGLKYRVCQSLEHWVHTIVSKKVSRCFE